MCIYFYYVTKPVVRMELENDAMMPTPLLHNLVQQLCSATGIVWWLWSVEFECRRGYDSARK